MLVEVEVEVEVEDEALGVADVGKNVVLTFKGRGWCLGCRLKKVEMEAKTLSILISGGEFP